MIKCYNNCVNISRAGTRHKVEERNISGVDINLAKTGRGHPYIRLVDVSARFYQCGKYRPGQLVHRSTQLVHLLIEHVAIQERM